MSKISDIKELLNSYEDGERVEGAELLVEETDDFTFDSVDDTKKELIELAFQSALDNNSKVRELGTKSLSKIVDGDGVSQNLNKIESNSDIGSYLQRIHEIAIENLKSEYNDDIRQWSALTINRYAKDDYVSIATRKTVDNLVKLLEETDQELPFKRATLALSNLGGYDAQFKDLARSGMAENIDQLRDLASDGNNQLRKSVGLRALGLTGLSYPESVLPCWELHNVVEDAEARTKNRNRALRSLWQIGITYPGVIEPVFDTVVELLQFSDEDAKSANNRKKDNLSKLANFVRSNAAKTLCVLALERPDRISEEALNQGVQLIDSSDEAIHRAILLLGEVASSNPQIIESHDGFDVIAKYLSTEQYDISTKKRHTKARGYAVWALTKSSMSLREFPIPQAQALEYLLETPKSEQTRFGRRLSEALVYFAAENPQLVLDSETAVDYLSSQVRQNSSLQKRRQAVTAFYYTAVSDQTELSKQIRVLLKDCFTETSDPSLKSLIIQSLSHSNPEDSIDWLFHNKMVEENALVEDTIENVFNTVLKDRVADGYYSYTADDTEPSAAEFFPWIRSTIQYDDFEQIKRISIGGTGRIDKGLLKTDTDLPNFNASKVVAMKRPRRFDNETLSERVNKVFINEAEKWAQVHAHPNIVTIFAWGQKSEPWILMEYLGDGTLHNKLQSGPLSPSQAIWMGIRIADALKYAHTDGVYHHDITPKNILFGESGGWSIPKLADWGTANKRNELSATNQSYTPRYAAPEQITTHSSIDNEDNPEVTDVYQLAIVIYESLTGELPFETKEEKLDPTFDPDPPSDNSATIPESVDELLLTSLSVEPENRTPNMHQFLERLCQSI